MEKSRTIADIEKAMENATQEDIDAFAKQMGILKAIERTIPDFNSRLNFLMFAIAGTLAQNNIDEEVFIKRLRQSLKLLDEMANRTKPQAH